MAAIPAEVPNQNVQSERPIWLRLFNAIHARLKSVSMQGLSVETALSANQKGTVEAVKNGLTWLTALTAIRILFFLRFFLFSLSKKQISK
jgi:hypothetical protein